MYTELSIAAQTAYAELFDQRQSLDVQNLASLNGSFHQRTVKGASYWYFGYRDLNGKSKATYVGPDSDRVRKIIESASLAKRSEAVIEKQAKAALALGCQSLAAKHFKIIDRFAKCGLFKSGGVLIGTHAFLTMGNILGVKWRGGSATLDVDFAHAGKNISIALPGDFQFDVKSAIESLEMGLTPIASLDGGYGAQYRNPADPELRIDFVTCEHRDPGYVRLPNTSFVLEPLKFMEFSLEEVTQGIALSKNGHSCMVNVPAPARFAIHKLIVFGERSQAQRVKSQKDLLQAASLISCLIDQGHLEELNRAWNDACSRGKGWTKRVVEGKVALIKRFPELDQKQALE